MNSMKLFLFRSYNRSKTRYLLPTHSFSMKTSNMEANIKRMSRKPCNYEFVRKKYLDRYPHRPQTQSPPPYRSKAEKDIKTLSMPMRMITRVVLVKVMEANHVREKTSAMVVTHRLLSYSIKLIRTRRSYSKNSWACTSMKAAAKDKQMRGVNDINRYFGNTTIAIF